LTRFEWDPAKSTANKAKHGIDFEEAQAIWDDADRVEIPVRRLTNEMRVPSHRPRWRDAVDCHYHLSP
jgi:uncharacterized DUF497 family protein